MRSVTIVVNSYVLYKYWITEVLEVQNGYKAINQQMIIFNGTFFIQRYNYLVHFYLSVIYVLFKLAEKYYIMCVTLGMCDQR